MRTYVLRKEGWAPRRRDLKNHRKKGTGTRTTSPAEEGIRLSQRGCEGGGQRRHKAKNEGEKKVTEGIPKVSHTKNGRHNREVGA